MSWSPYDLTPRPIVLRVPLASPRLPFIGPKVSVVIGDPPRRVQIFSLPLSDTLPPDIRFFSPFPSIIASCPFVSPALSIEGPLFISGFSYFSFRY